MCGSVTHALGRWVDVELQKLVDTLPFALCNTAQLLTELRFLPNLPPSARFVSFDAIFMYTNIGTTHALKAIDTFFWSHHSFFYALKINSSMTLEALSILMRRNVFTFDDMRWLQL